jgi:hypothetical protein
MKKMLSLEKNKQTETPQKIYALGARLFTVLKKKKGHIK